MNIEEEIKALQEQLDLLKAKQAEGCKPKGMWKPKDVEHYWLISHNNSAVYESFNDGHIYDEARRDFGNCYKTKEKAEQARDAMRKHNRMLAWLANNDDGWVADWSDSNQEKYYVYYSHDICKHHTTMNNSVELLNLVYMSKENAKELARQLNNGEFTL